MKIITKAILLCALCALSFTKANAQYVNVIDANFANWLQTNYPSCFNNGMLDTTCSALINETSLTLPTYFFDTLTNISEVKYFDGLQRFVLENNFVHSIDRFPAGLKKIRFYANPISTIFPPLPTLLDTLIINDMPQSNNVQFLTLPSSITHLDLASNNLSFLPTLPPNLITLNVSSNAFSNSGATVFLNSLPASLQSLSVTGCGITVIPQLPPNLIGLGCSGNQLYQLPNLPASLLYLYCAINNLGQLPPLPNNLHTLDISYNGIANLPDTLPPNLVALFITSTQIDTIPNLPQSLVNLTCDGTPIVELPSNFTSSQLQFLSCSHCSLTYIPTTPVLLNYLNCSDNQIGCFGVLSSNLSSPIQLNLSNNPFICVPNYVQAMDSVFVAAHTLCVPGDTVNNPNNCSMAKGITGTIFKDHNNDCLYDTSDNILNNIKVNFFDPVNSEFSSTFSGNSGVYFNTLNPSIYLLSLDTLNNSYTFNCQYPGLDTMVTTTIAQPLANDVNFAISCKPGYDLGVQSIAHAGGIPFPGEQHTMKIVAGDISQWYNLNCAQGIYGQVVLTLSGPVTLLSTAPNALTPSTIASNVLTYNIADFGIVDIDSAFVLNLLTNTNAQAGNQICIQVSITSAGNDYNLYNNTYSYCYPAVNSYDPNYKTVNPINVETGYNDWFTYTVYFQNLGNAPAFNINIIDTLDQNLDVSTFQVIGYSHPNNVTVNNRTVTARFPNIMLADSASNPTGSIGYIQYRVKPLSNLLVGATIKNTAHIYLDFNAPIATNTTVNNFTTTVGVSESQSNTSALSIYPNPSNRSITVKTNNPTTVSIVNLVGEEMMSIKVQNQTTIDISSYAKGIYFVKTESSKTVKFVKN